MRISLLCVENLTPMRCLKAWETFSSPCKWPNGCGNRHFQLCWFVIVMLYYQHFFIIPFQRILLVMPLPWHRSSMATIAQECACPTICGEQGQLSLKNVPAVTLVTHVCSLWGCPHSSLPPFLTRAHLQLYPQRCCHTCVSSSSYSLVSLHVSFLPWRLPLSRGTTRSSLLITFWWALGCFHPFQSCLELAVAGTGQFMALSHTGLPAAPTTNHYQLCLIHVRQIFPTLMPFPKFQKISKVFYMEISFALKLPFRTLHCK